MIRRPSLDDTSGAELGGGPGQIKVTPLAQGVVIGVGGSGIQTISRVKSAIEAARPEAAARSALSFLGVDAVLPERQHPPLPPGIGLRKEEYFNLTSTPFDAAALVRNESNANSPLNEWWDFAQSVPSGPLTDGLKQNRPLGRLAFYRAGSDLVQRVTQAMVQSARVDRDVISSGVSVGGSAGVRPKVYIAASMCGGTGSAGLLDVVHKVWVAASRMGLSPEIQLFLFLPGIFEGEIIRSSMDSTAEIDNLRANAYAFLTELDHFITHSDQLDGSVARPDRSETTLIPPGELVKQVFLIDRQLTSGSFITSVTDAYEVAAAAIYQLLMTKTGTQVAVNGVNVDTLLREVDGFNKRRIYCGLGLSAITYPGDTFRRHLSFRFADWFVRRVLLVEADDLPEKVREHEVATSLVTQLSALRDDLATFTRDDSVRLFEQDCRGAAATLAADHAPEAVDQFMATINNRRPVALRVLDEQLTSRRARAMAAVAPVVLSEVSGAGQSVPFAIDLLKHVESRLHTMVAASTKLESQHQNTASQADVQLEEAERSLRGTSRWQFWGGGRQRPATELGEAVAAHGGALIGQRIAAAQTLYLRSAISTLSHLREQLEGAQRALQGESARFAAAWRADNLVGKDAGSVSLTALIPSDVQPEVEDSSLAKESFAALLEEVEALDTTELLRDLYRKWARATRTGHGLFDLGSDSKDLQGGARSELLELLTDLASRFALQEGETGIDATASENAIRPRLPRSLKEAADRMDDGVSLKRALMSAAGLTQQVLLPIDDTLLQARAPSPASIVSYPRSVADLVKEFVPEQVGRQIIEWPDDERFQVFTTMWGASAHVLGAIPTWKAAYERAITSAPHDPNHRRPHLDVRWLDSLDPLQPSYVDAQLAARSIVRARMATKLLEDAQVHSAIFGPNPLTGEIGKPLNFEDSIDRVRWRAHTFEFDRSRERWVKSWQDYDFGSTWNELVKSVGNAGGFRQRTEIFTSAVLRASGRASAIAVVEALLTDVFDELVRQGSSNPDEQRARELLQRETAELLAEFRATETAAS